MQANGSQPCPASLGKGHLAVQHELSHRGGLVMEGRADVAVHAERDRDHRVSEPLLNNSWVDSLFERERRPGGAQAMQGEAFQAVAAHSAKEHLAEYVGVRPAAVGLMEDKAFVVEVGTDQHPLFE